MARGGEGRDERLALAALMMVAFTVGTDFTGVMLLVPAIEGEFAVDITTTQWVLNIYALAFAMFMVAGGKLGDIYGRRRLMVIGLAIFIGGSTACALAPTMGLLILARACQGFGAAMIWPSMLGSGATLVEEERRGVVMGLLLASVNAGNVAGPLMSGVIVVFADWRLFFTVNVVLSCVCLLLAFRFLPATRPQRVSELPDFAGIGCLGLAVLSLLFALDVGADWGWESPRLLALLVLSAALFAAFPFVEARVRNPMVPPRWLRHREFRLLLAINGLIMPPIFIAFLYFPQYIQKVLGWRELLVSFGVLPMMAILAVASVFSGRFYKSLGPRCELTFAYVLVTLGAAAVVWLNPSWGYFALVPPMILLALGVGSGVGTAGTATVNAVSERDASLAGGLGFMMHLVIGSLGVAGATAIMNATSLGSVEQGLSRAGISLSPADVAMLNGSEPGGAKTQAVLGEFDATTTETIHGLLREAFAAGLSDAFWLALAAGILGLLAVYAVNEARLHHALAEESEELEETEPLA